MRGSPVVTPVSMDSLHGGTSGYQAKNLRVSAGDKTVYTMDHPEIRKMRVIHWDGRTVTPIALSASPDSLVITVLVGQHKNGWAEVNEQISALITEVSLQYHSPASKSNRQDPCRVFKELADAYGLTDPEKKKCLVRYTDIKTKRFWMSLDAYSSGDYAALKEQIQKSCPGGRHGQKFTLQDLETIVAANATNPLNTETEVMEYYQEFRPVAQWLVDAKKITTSKRDWYFWADAQ
ncbi:hypothetical protein GLOTRDRAFT_134265 [Gloeophyllum trabeum ATCC 11539]|uniref:Uncharacterized protein n=1 Tax=Gloeophyllum trabeum (strain ATCC 11539 / FP-39264 / Madison 617) TaxID=670483 RepID=S7R6S7_GLOTA|nr:uncharacterized protein GLOTRDRAFT_134265 [Gloeophyllum trabeum ATCC 11539]EPQ50090.1 hypothetical protein GLOTRDRAFT_134265 [Gloeophyllum trabeum ATCC 11539]